MCTLPPPASSSEMPEMGNAAAGGSPPCSRTTSGTPANEQMRLVMPLSRSVAPCAWCRRLSFSAHSAAHCCTPSRRSSMQAPCPKRVGAASTFAGQRRIASPSCGCCTRSVLIKSSFGFCRAACSCLHQHSCCGCVPVTQAGQISDANLSAEEAVDVDRCGCVVFMQRSVGSYRCGCRRNGRWYWICSWHRRELGCRQLCRTLDASTSPAESGKHGFIMLLD